MQAQNLLVDEITIDSASINGVVNSTLYEFHEPEWVSYHSGREGKQIGPLTILKKEGAPDSFGNTSIRSFGNRTLRTEGTPASPVVSYQDRWTVPFYTVYTLVLPARFVATQIRLNCTESMGWCFPLQMGVNNGRLFYHTLFAEHRSRQHSFEVEARLELNESRYMELSNSTEIVNGTNEFKQFGWAIINETKKPDFWFKLLELGAKFIGR